MKEKRKDNEYIPGGCIKCKKSPITFNRCPWNKGMSSSDLLAQNKECWVAGSQESKYKDLDKGAFVPGQKPGEVIVIKEGKNVQPISGSGKKVVMSNSNTGKGKSQGPTQKFYSSSNPDASNLSTKSILGVIG